ncbi:MAG: hypothetical protein JO361_10865 [Gammaproteobacteria bacterium]|nr:hypothetical protein [Gammaproteobacteria bacterium]
MPASLLEEAKDSGVPAVLAADGSRSTCNRRLLWAGAGSLLVHLLVLLTLGPPGYHSSAPASAPELRLYVDPTYGGADAGEAAAAPPSAAAAELPPRKDTILATAAHAGAPTLRAPAPAPATVSSSGADPEHAGGSDEGGTGDAAASSATTPANPAGDTDTVLTTISVSPARAAAPPGAGLDEAAGGAPQMVAAAIGGAQKSVLERWIVQAAQRLRGANLARARLSFRHAGHDYTAVLERRPAANAMDLEHVNVEINTEDAGHRLRTRLDLKQLAFSSFTQLVDHWDMGVMLHADEIDGRFHSNSDLMLSYDHLAPRLTGRVTTAGARINIAHGGGLHLLRKIFLGGFETGAPRIELPGEFPAMVAAGGGSADSSRVRAFGHATRIVFYPDGSYGWQEIGSDAPEQRQPVSTPHYIVGARGAPLSVRGTVRGTLVVYSPERIVVEGSLRYAHDPHSDPAADDYLGLISGKDIEVAPRQVTGPGDLEIYAALYAKRRFLVRDEEAPDGRTSCPCEGTLRIHGSLTAGSLSPTEERYATRYTFDARFEQVRPPGFPTTDTFAVDAWDMQWREAAAPAADAAGPEPASTTRF